MCKKKKSFCKTLNNVILISKYVWNKAFLDYVLFHLQTLHFRILFLSENSLTHRYKPTNAAPGLPWSLQRLFHEKQRTQSFHLLLDVMWICCGRKLNNFQNDLSQVSFCVKQGLDSVATNEFGYVNSDWIISKYDSMGKPLVFFPEVTLGSHLVIANKCGYFLKKSLHLDSSMNYWERSFLQFHSCTSVKLNS